MTNLAREPESSRCPNCSEWINSEAILCRFCHCGLSSTHFHPCTFCAEMVRKEATRCRYCQSDLPETKQRKIDMHVVRPTESEPQSFGFNANMKLVDERAEILCAEFREDSTLDLNDTDVRIRIRELVNSDPAPLTMMEKGILLQKVLDELVGFGPLGPVLRDPSVRDIYVYGPSQVHVSRGRAIEKTDVTFKNDEHINAVIASVFKSCGARLTKKAQINTCTLSNGTIVIAVFASSSKDEAMLILRTPRE